MITATGPQQLLPGSRRSAAKRGHRWAMAAAIGFFVVGALLIGVVLRDLSSPSVFMGGIACLLVSAMSLVLMIMLDMFRTLVRELGDIRTQLAELRTKQDREHDTVNRALWGQGHRDRENG